jgi:hypothetical protein
LTNNKRARGCARTKYHDIHDITLVQPSPGITI